MADRDRCLLISENRPEWFITDLSVMLSEAITVPAYTTYAEKDYEYIIENCSPKLIFVSNQEQFNKVKEIIKKKSFVVKKQNRKTRSPIAPGLASRTCHLSQRGAPMWLGPGPWSAGGMSVPYRRPVS